MPVFLITVLTKLGIPERFRKGLLVALAVAAVIALAWGAKVLVDNWVTAQSDEAVQVDRNAVSAAVDNRQVQAERDATLNQLQADADFRNEQHNAQEAADAAARNSTSPLDSLFDKLR